MRLFTAIELTESIKDNIVKASSDLKSSSVKFVKRNELHITLTFSSDVDEGSINTLVEALKLVKSNMFKISVNGVGVFNPEYIRVIFAKVTEGSNEIKNIYEQIALVLESHNISFDRKEFVPHITIARVRSNNDRQSISSFIEKYKVYEFGSFLVSSFSLIKSVLSSSGPEYTTLFKFDF
jgi:2'-5' RNA ligase